MKFIRFHKDRCDNCYKCLRVCPTKAIAFSKNDRKIIDGLCIKCGLCQASCPQEALDIQSELSKVYQMMDNKEKIAVSIAPSYVGAFGMTEPKRMVGALKSLGFDYIEETAFGAELIAMAYDDAIEKNDKTNIITSCCPSANYLIEQHYPTLIQYMLPLVSPMIAHGRSMKQRYGEQTKVVFIGPCLAKMAEAEEMRDAVDAVLTFAELESMIKNKGEKIHHYEPMEFEVHGSGRGKAFPLGGSLRNKKNKAREDDAFRYVHVTGIESCKEILNELRLGNIENYCIEINICEGSCMNGPDMPKNHLGRFSRESFMRAYTKQETVHANALSHEALEKHKSQIHIERSFHDRQMDTAEPNIQIVHQTMMRMGKYSQKDELNCGACGYKTCYDKAKAVYFGYSDVDSCLPYLRQKAESMQSIMIEKSPNAVVLLNKDMTIHEVNPSFIQLFNQDGLPMIDMPMRLFVDHPIFEELQQAEKSVERQKIQVGERFFWLHLIQIKEEHRMLVFLTDMTTDERRRQELSEVKKETLIKTQEVIDKQMRVAQEIASLLGETTAETKMSLKSLNDLVLKDRSEF